MGKTSFQNMASSRREIVKEVLQVNRLECCLKSHWTPKLEALESPEEAPLCLLHSPAPGWLWPQPPAALTTRTAATPDSLREKPVDTLSHRQNVDMTGNLDRDYSHFQRNLDIKMWSVPRVLRNFPECLYLFLLITWWRGGNRGKETEIWRIRHHCQLKKESIDKALSKS